ncbi:hypothetical protein QO190_12775 [Cloacibacterium sp. Arc13]|uniref:hypothetical protein n=1 Tax=unclassified Cloacibacterium TaxID=2620870 RepID=UPI00352DB8DD
MKTNLKKSIALLVLCFTAMAFNKVQAQTTYEYFVPVAWEHQYGKSGGQPVVGNVVKIEADCPAANTGVFNDFHEHYKAYYSKNRGFTGLNAHNVRGPYISYEEASKARTKIIADFNYKWNPLIINDFSTSCNK